MRIGILGTRGIPNNYGGFEQWAEQLSLGLVAKGYDVYVYNSHNHPYQKNKWAGVNIIHKYDPEFRVGTVGQFIYDLNCIVDSRTRKFDIILQLGYTSSSIWGWLLPKQKALIVTNMDGFEWNRGKFSRTAKYFLKQAEKLGVYFSDIIIADSPVIKKYYKSRYTKPVVYIPYGTKLFFDEDFSKISSFNIDKYNYYLLIARLEPENNIEMVIQGVIKSKSQLPLLIVGNYNIPHGKYLFNKYSKEKQIKFTGAIYNSKVLNNLRFFSNLYFHGHSVGGTNPSLLEAMACSAVICAHDNPYNKAVLTNKGWYFSTVEDIYKLILSKNYENNRKETISRNRQTINTNFLVEDIINKYYNMFLEKIISKSNNN